MFSSILALNHSRYGKSPTSKQPAQLCSFLCSQKCLCSPAWPCHSRKLLLTAICHRRALLNPRLVLGGFCQTPLLWKLHMDFEVGDSEVSGDCVWLLLRLYYGQEWKFKYVAKQSRLILKSQKYRLQGRREITGRQGGAREGNRGEKQRHVFFHVASQAGV